MRRSLLVACVVVLVAGVVVSLAAGSSESGSAAKGRWVPQRITGFDPYGWTYPVAINDSGLVLAVGNGRGGLWRPGVFRDLGITLDDERGDVIRGLNAGGQVVGGMVRAGSEYVRAFVWSEGRVRWLDPETGAGSFSSEANGINDRGQAVGWASWRQAVVWADAKRNTLPTPKGMWSEAVAINERGTVVGVVSTRNMGYGGVLWDTSPREGMRAVVWRAGRMTVLPTLGGASAALDINERGQIVGWSADRSGAERVVMWQGKQIRVLDRRFTFDGHVAINDFGLIVGARKGRVSVWEAGRLTDLGRVFERAGAVDVNNKRTILAYDYEDEGFGCCEYVYRWVYQPK